MKKRVPAARAIGIVMKLLQHFATKLRGFCRDDKSSWQKLMVLQRPAVAPDSAIDSTMDSSKLAKQKRQYLYNTMDWMGRKNCSK